MAETTSTTDTYDAPKGGSGIFWYAALAGVLIILLHESLFMGKGLVAADGVLGCPPWGKTMRLSNVSLSDQFMVFLPTQEFVYRQKHLPLWNPCLCCGLPNLGNIQAAVLFPIRLLLSPLDPFAASGPAAFIKLCLAGWFMLMYLRLIGVSNPGAFLGGIAFSLSSFMIIWLGHPHVNSAMWLPLLLYFTEKSFGMEGRKALRVWAGFAIAFAFMILGGHPPTAIHVTIVVSLYFLYRLLEHRRQVLQQAGMLAGAVMAGLLLSAPQLLPYLEYYRESSSPLASATLERWSSHLNPVSLFHFLLPNVMGNSALGYVDLPRLLKWPETNEYNERTAYVGIVPLFLAVFAAAYRRCKFTKFFLALAVASLLVIFGIPPLPNLVKALPVLCDINQERLLLAVVFSLAVLAGLGWDALARTETRRQARNAIIGCCVVVGMALVWFGVYSWARMRLLDASRLEFIERQFLILGAGIVVAILMALWPANWKRWPVMAAGLIWTSFDLLCVGYGFNPSITRDHYYPPTPALEWLQQDTSAFRIFAIGGMLVPNTAEAFGLSDVRGADFMSVRRYEELIAGKAGRIFFYLGADRIPEAFPLLNVKYILGAMALPLDPRRFDRVYGKEICIYRDKQCVDRAIVVHDCQVEPDSNALLQRVRAKGFDPRQVLLVEEQPEPVKQAGGAARAEESARIVSYEPDEVKIEASLARPGYLVLLDTYFPGWSATVNGQSARIMRADYNFRAVALPAGESSVRFSYYPNSLKTGIVVCMAGLAAVVTAWFLAWPRKKEDQDDEYTKSQRNPGMVRE